MNGSDGVSGSKGVSVSVGSVVVSVHCAIAVDRSDGRGKVISPSVQSVLSVVCGSAVTARRCFWRMIGSVCGLFAVLILVVVVC